MTEKLTYDDPIARTVAAAAMARGWTITVLAERAGMNRGSLSQKMNRLQGRRLTGDDLTLLGDALGVSPMDLAGRVLDLRVTDDGPLVTNRYLLPFRSKKDARA